MTLRLPSPFRTAVAAAALVLAVAGCRGEEPDQAPPIGRTGAAAPVAAVDAGGTATAPSVAPAREDAPDATTALAVSRAHAAASLPLRERARRYREAAAVARAALDTAWNGCGALEGPAASRCRDDAVVAYDAAIGEARALWGDDVGMAPADAPSPGVLDRTTDLALLQVTGTRG